MISSDQQTSTTNASFLDETKPLLVGAEMLAELLQVSKRTLFRLRSSGSLPKPIQLGRGTLRWSVQEVKDWVAAGCPKLNEWERIKKLPHPQIK